MKLNLLESGGYGPAEPKKTKSTKEKEKILNHSKQIAGRYASTSVFARQLSPKTLDSPNVVFSFLMVLLDLQLWFGIRLTNLEKRCKWNLFRNSERHKLQKMHTEGALSHGFVYNFSKSSNLQASGVKKLLLSKTLYIKNPLTTRTIKKMKTFARCTQELVC